MSEEIFSRGFATHNPGNIKKSKVKYEGEIESSDPAYKAFVSDVYGYRAMFMILFTYQKRYLLKTIPEFIKRYAPKKENDVDRYVDFVSKKSGIEKEEIVNTKEEEEIIPIVNAMAWFETGTKPNPTDVKKGFELFLQYIRELPTN